MINKKEILDFIPFDRKPDDKLLALIKEYDPKKKNTTMPLEKLGSGASRDVFLWEGNALKIEKPGNRHFGQNKTEVMGYINYPEIRKWLPQIWSYSKDYKWSIVEVCEYKNRAAHNSLMQYQLDSYKRIKEWMDNNEVKCDKFEEFMKAKSHTHKINLKRDILLYKSLLTDNADYSVLKNKFPHNDKDLNEVMSKLKSLLVKDNFTLRDNRVRKRDKNGKRIKEAKLEKNSWNLLYDWIRYGHPLIVDLVDASIKHKKTFSDLHEKNLGISKYSEYPYDIRILDLGIIK